MVTALERLRTLLAREFGLEPQALQPGATLESLDIDSLRLIEILFCIEEEFGISMPQDQAGLRERLHTLGDLAELVESLAAEGPPA
ncbi:MAG TPA: phosphopantetheine-binding protein [Myxococcota bacterium]|nr:phosphopantetheine-binding protein [Myxococcota bacterium]